MKNKTSSADKIGGQKLEKRVTIPSPELSVSGSEGINLSPAVENGAPLCRHATNLSNIIETSRWFIGIFRRNS